MYKNILLVFTCFAAFSVSAQQKVIPLYDGAAPGSEKWKYTEQLSEKNAFNTPAVYNVSKPTLTVYPADPDVRNTGTGVIICPGGAFYVLSVEKEGADLARWLNKKGITAFVLKYRLAESKTADPVQELIDKEKSGPLKLEKLPVVNMAIADGRNAIAYVRKHAAEYGIQPKRVGIVGFSAGGTVSASSASGYTEENRPDFVGAIYPFLPEELSKPVPADAPPLFIAAASDDFLNKEKQNINLYNKWLSAKRQAEIHVYNKGGHAFGMNKSGTPSESWIDRFGDWLDMQGLFSPDNKTDAERQKSAQDWGNFHKSVEERVRNDWPWRSRYEYDNAKLPSPAVGEKHIVFLGNSITQGWIDTDPDFFKGKTYVNRGIGGQTTPQMLLRFRQDVINLKPAAVIILAGINDIAQNTGPITIEAIYGNIVSMAELAKANNIKVIFSSVLPAYDFPWKKGMEPVGKVMKLNSMLKAYADKNNMTYVDYFSAMADERKGLPADLAYDGVHPTLKGYKIMEPLAEKGIAEALAKK